MAKTKARESQNVEYKSSWHDEYLKWICGFANAQGAVMYLGFIDAWGRGYKKIREGFESTGLPMPKIEEADGGVRVTFMRKNVNNGNVVDVVVGNAVDELTERQEVIYNAIRQNVIDGVAVTASSLAKQLKVHPRTIQRNLAVLASKQFILHVGPDRTGHWEPVKM